MQQRQPRLGDILDDYCPRERRLTNHVVVAMIGDAVKQTRCTTCDSDHEYKHAAVPRPRKKSEQSDLYSQVLANVTPKKTTPTAASVMDFVADEEVQPLAVSLPDVGAEPVPSAEHLDDLFDIPAEDEVDGNRAEAPEEGPAHRRLIRAQLPRHEGQAATTRQPTDFTIRQPTNARAKRFMPRNPSRSGASAGGGPQFQGNRSGSGMGNGGNTRGGAARQGGRPQGAPGGSRPGHRQGGRNRPK